MPRLQGKSCLAGGLHAQNNASHYAPVLSAFPPNNVYRFNQPFSLQVQVTPAASHLPRGHLA